ncbi:MAG: hypothetical protein ABIB71_06500 [Candidatus Woesearchaeota archaeon]
MGLEKLLRKRLQLSTKKYFLAEMLFHGHYPHKRTLFSLRRTLDREIGLNMRIADTASMSRKLELGAEAYRILKQLHDSSNKLVAVLRGEWAILKSLEGRKLLRKTLKKEDIVAAGKSFFDLMDQEKKIEGIFIKHVSGAARLAQDRVLLEGITLLKEYFGVYKMLLDSMGNRAAVNRYSKRLMEIWRRLNKAEIYAYIKSDVEAVQRKVLYVLENPKKSRIAYFLAGAYIFTPMSTEIITGLLAVRYITKYTVNKAKKLGRKRLLKKI